MSIIARARFFVVEKILGKYLYKTMNEWSEITRDWKKDDWISYWNKKLKKLLLKKHNRERYTNLRPEDIYSIFDYPPEKTFPDIKTRFAISVEKTSGTTGKSKSVPLLLGDIITGIRTTRGYVEESCNNNIVFVSSGMYKGKLTTSYNRMEMVSRIFRAGGNNAVHIPVNEFESDIYIKKVKKHIGEKIEVISALTGQYTYVIKKLESFLGDELRIVPSGSVLTESMVNDLKNVLSEIGIDLKKILNYYIATEIPGAAGWSRGDNWEEITIDPTSNIPGIVPFKISENDADISNKVYPIWKVPKGTRGFFAPTLLREILVLNYIGLKDVIEVSDPNSWPPKIIHRGRWEYKIEIPLKTLGTLKGTTGEEVRVAGHPFNMYDFYSLISKLLKDDMPFIRVIDKGFSGEIIVYHKKKLTQIDAKEIASLCEKSMNLYFLAKVLKSGTVTVRFVYAPDVVSEIYNKLHLVQALSGKSPKAIYWIVERL